MRCAGRWMLDAGGWRLEVGCGMDELQGGAAGGCRCGCCGCCRVLAGGGRADLRWGMGWTDAGCNEMSLLAFPLPGCRLQGCPLWSVWWAAALSVPGLGVSRAGCCWGSSRLQAFSCWVEVMPMLLPSFCLFSSRSARRSTAPGGWTGRAIYLKEAQTPPPTG